MIIPIHCIFAFDQKAAPQAGKYSSFSLLKIFCCGVNVQTCSISIKINEKKPKKSVPISKCHCNNSTRFWIFIFPLIKDSIRDLWMITGFRISTIANCVPCTLHRTKKEKRCKNWVKSVCNSPGYSTFYFQNLLFYSKKKSNSKTNSTKKK